MSLDNSNLTCLEDTVYSIERVTERDGRYFILRVCVTVCVMKSNILI